MMDLARFLRRAITVPFVPRGRAWDGWDCYGLVYIAYMELFDLALPRYDDYDEKLAYKELSALVDQGRPTFRETARPKYGDLALFRVGRYPAHIGMVVPGGKMLHAEQGVGTAIESLKSAAWCDRLEGYYEYARD